uniref:nicotinate phosphoribosyltransferase n=1 Tax=Oryctolagus cuniculus TaxID=9986 RepID=G1U654_RABIT
MKLTEDPEKQTLPGSKAAFRLLGADGEPLPTLHVPLKSPEPPSPCRSRPSHTQGPCCRTCCSWRKSRRPRWSHSEPHRSRPLTLPFLQLCQPLPSLAESRAFAQLSLSRLGPAHRRLHGPELYQVALSEKLQALVDSLSARGSP